MDVDVSLPPWARDFTAPHRYKVAYGGRGGSKSWAFARLLLLEALVRPLRVLCARELQVSIRESVHKLLGDQIDALGLSSRFSITRDSIRSRVGAEFVFKGLRHNTDEIKSMEGIDRCWVEEAHRVSDASWQLLIPTIRAPGSEIWISFNPDQATDPTHQRFVLDPPPGTLLRKVSYRDNPYFPPELEAERLYLARVDPDAYDHVWEGNTRRFTEAQVLRGKWHIDVFTPAKNWDGPYFGVDWGFAEDPSVMVKCWVFQNKLYVEHEAYGVGVANDDLPRLFDRVPGARAHTSRADSARPETIDHLRKRGFPRMVAAAKGPGSVEHGVETLRSFEQIVIHDRCKHTAEEAALWCYKTDRLTGDILPVLVDKHNHAWDAIRYALEPMMRRERQAPVTAGTRTF